MRNWIKRRSPNNKYVVPQGDYFIPLGQQGLGLPVDLAALNSMFRETYSATLTDITPSTYSFWPAHLLPAPVQPSFTATEALLRAQQMVNEEAIRAAWMTDSYGALSGCECHSCESLRRGNANQTESR